MRKKTIILSTIPTKKPFLQIGLYYLKAYAEKYCQNKNNVSINVEVFTSDKDSLVESYYKQAVKMVNKKPYLIGFSCYCWNVAPILYISKIIKNINPSIHIVLGGPEVSDDPVGWLKKINSIDMIVRDEGEATFAELLDALLKSKANLSKVKGLTYRTGKKIVTNPDREPLDLKEVPSPYLAGNIDLLNKELNYVVETSRGCPFNCAYCSYSVRGYRRIRFFPLDTVKQELELILKKKPVALWINDDNFNIHPPRAVEILKSVKKFHGKTSVSTFINASQWIIDDKLVKTLGQNKVTCLIGVQSTDPHVLSIISRRNNFPILEKNLRSLDRNKVGYTLDFIYGLPGQRYNDLVNSYNWAYRFKASLISFYRLQIFKGTELYKMIKPYGIRVQGSPIYEVQETDTLSRKDLNNFYPLFTLSRSLYNEGILVKTLRHLIDDRKMLFSSVALEWKTIAEKSHQSSSDKETELAFKKGLIDKYGLRPTTTLYKEVMSANVKKYLTRIKSVVS